ncbi:helix-turn-helix domain-containing protein [Streptomyces atratus]|uniref:helix-turn-helix domain-containing protein n=1 Tax=Streptomyces atratus TaxID=1893 RepID=UPI0033E33589
MLGFIGLAEGEEAAYRALVQLGAATSEDIARYLGLGEEEAARLLQRILRHDHAGDR